MFLAYVFGESMGMLSRFRNDMIMHFMMNLMESTLVF